MDKPKSVPQIYKSAREANETLDSIRQMIGFGRVKILEVMEGGYRVEYNGNKFNIAGHEESHWVGGSSGGMGMGMGLHLRQTMTLVPESGIYQDRDAPEEFIEVMMFHEIREKEYADAGFEDAHERALRDEAMYILQHFDGEAQGRYLAWAKAYRMEVQRLKSEEEVQEALDEFVDSARNNPANFFSEIEENKDQPGYDKALVVAANASAELCPEVILENAELLNEKPHLNEILEKAARGLLMKNPKRLLELVHYIKGMPWESEVIRDAEAVILRAEEAKKVEEKRQAEEVAKMKIEEEKMAQEAKKPFLLKLKDRFENPPKHYQRPENIYFSEVENALAAYPEKLDALQKLEETGGEPDILAVEGDYFVFCDFSAESPVGRRNLRYRQAEGQAARFGVDLITFDYYQKLLQKNNAFDHNSRSWLKTRAGMFKHGFKSTGYYEKERGECFWGCEDGRGCFPDVGWRGLLRVKKSLNFSARGGSASGGSL